MTVISRRVATPLPGKAALAITRAKSLAAIMKRAGSNTSLRKIIFGDEVGDIHLYGRYENFTHGTKAAVDMGKDPEMLAWHAAR
ncbi:MAG: hypothetical protein EXR05_05625 [Acetobacteraceae bacterium]|nr:hypothetical protein [Acetobacteraceae bacterium]